MQLTRESKLFVKAWSSIASQTVLVSGLLQGKDGKIKPFEYSLVVAALRSLTQDVYDLEEGDLLSVRAYISGGDTKRGHCFVQVFLCAFGANFAAGKLQLISDYVYNSFSPSWPGGIQKDSIEGPGAFTVVSVANPSAGANLSYAVPQDALYKLFSVRFRLVTSATVADRLVQLAIDDATTNLFFVGAPSAQGGSTTFDYYFGVVAANTYSAGVIPGLLNGPIMLPAGFKIKAVIDSIQVGDQISVARIYAEEWIQE